MLNKFDRMPLRADWKEEHEQIYLQTSDDLYIYDRCGRLQDTMSLKTRQEDNLFSDRVQDVLVNSRRNIVYIATESRVIAFDLQSQEVMDQVIIGLGVNGIRESSDGKLFVPTMNGVLVYELR